MAINTATHRTKLFFGSNDELMPQTTIADALARGGVVARPGSSPYELYHFHGRR